MAASVENRQLMSRLGVVHAFKAGPNHRRPDSPAPRGRRSNNFPTPPEITQPVKLEFLDDSSGEDDENENDMYTSTINKGKAEVERPIMDSRDQGTADHWVERNASLVRLTGKHPFNSEPPLNRLMHHGFITPAPIHYVRNHGPVPRANWEDWTVEVTGLVKRPARFSMEQLVSEFPSRELPVTLVCAGNRRKEQNMIKQTIGFNWGAAAVATSVWCGVPLRCVLQRCGILSRRNGALNVCFEGAEDLPGGGGGSKYGTSIRKEIAMDPSRDILLAYVQNGERLSPDHGFPVRMIIPGFIGGRMVKWLKRIIVTTPESDSYYHFNDNRVLPSHVDAELANAEAWWYKPEYIITELNINSVITTPCHDEILSITTSSWTTQRPYTLRGYAYSGGGKKVTRVEVTMDGGETWQVCQLDHPEKPNKYGKYWCWCFWSLDVEVLHLVGAKEVAVRAWDETLNTQPEKLIWNLMGMMNNCWFRVKTKVCKPNEGVEMRIAFEHPTEPGNQSGGWMARERHLHKASDSNQYLNEKKSVPSSPIIRNSNTSSIVYYSMSEVHKHSSAESAWIVVHGQVYDCTSFLKDHPGGADSILINAGTDCTEDFDAIHSDKAKNLLGDYRIGDLLATVTKSITMPHLAPISEIAPATRVALVNPREIIKCVLVEKTSISHSVRKFRFALPSNDQSLGVPVGKHIFLRSIVDDKLCMRAYTPTSSADQLGYFDLVVKIYLKGVNAEFPNGGMMSQFLDSLVLGSTLDVKGPLGHIEYTGKGNFIAHGKHKFAKRLAMIAGGTGITPLYQVIQAVLRDPHDRTEMHLVYANQTDCDVLLREELDRWAERDGDRLTVWYIVREAKREGWRHGTGRITEGVLREHIPGPSGNTLTLACGPKPMIECTVQPYLKKMGFDVDNSLLIF